MSDVEPGIPEFLIAPKAGTPEAEARKARNLAYKWPYKAPPPEEEEWKVQRDRMKALQDEVDRQKSARSLAALHDKHPGQKYDRKLMKWVPITVEVTNGDDA